MKGQVGWEMEREDGAVSGDKAGVIIWEGYCGDIDC